MISLHVDKLKTGWPTHGRQRKSGLPVLTTLNRDLRRFRKDYC